MHHAACIIKLDYISRIIFNCAYIANLMRKAMSMDIPNRDGDGYLIDMSDWTPEIGNQMAKADGYELNEKKWEQIIKAREFYEEFGTVPPIRKFAKHIGEDQKEIFDLWMTGPMKPITKYGGMPKPTGCV
jgi:TusE/DsrC/DsvC family sulfur relay protein